MRRALLPLMKWLLALSALAGVLLLVHQLHERMTQQRAAEADSPPPVKRAANGVVKLGAEEAETYGIKDEEARAVSWARRVPAYGRVVSNPRATVEVRAAFAGTLRVGPEPWPTLGGRVKAGQAMGWLSVRVGPQEQLDLLTKLNEARQKQRGAEELVRLEQERADRHASAGAGVSRGELDMIQRQLTEARTQLATAKIAVRDWENALAAITLQGERKESTWNQALTAPAEGEIIEMPARQGMAVEPGALIARVVDFRQALVRLEMPPEALTAGPPSQVELQAARPAPVSPALDGASNRPEPEAPASPIPAILIGPAPQVETGSQLAVYWYEVDGARTPAAAVWRPGLFVKAWLPIPEARPLAAVAVPQGSLLYHQGRALVYVRLSPGRYERREVRVLGREGERWVLGDGVQAGERVVSQRAVRLLSEEFRGDQDND
jgi:hypothetical protein